MKLVFIVVIIVLLLLIQVTVYAYTKTSGTITKDATKTIANDSATSKDTAVKPYLKISYIPSEWEKGYGIRLTAESNSDLSKDNLVLYLNGYKLSLSPDISKSTEKTSATYTLDYNNVKSLLSKSVDLDKENSVSLTVETASGLRTSSSVILKSGKTITRVNDSGFGSAMTKNISDITGISAPKINKTVDVGCASQNGIIEPDFDYGRYNIQDPSRPDFLDHNNPDRIRTDCDVLDREDELSDYVNNTLEDLQEIEAVVEQRMEDANELLERGRNALECIRDVEYEELFPPEEDDSSTFHISVRIPPLYPSAGRWPSYIIGARSMSTTYDILATDVRNVNSDHNAARRGQELSRAELETLESLVQALEEHCNNRNCMFDDQERYYEDVMENAYSNAEYYIEATERVIEDARRAADHFFNYNRSWVGRDISGENLCDEDEDSILTSIADLGRAEIRGTLQISGSTRKDISAGRSIPVKINNRTGILERGRNKIQIRVNDSIVVLNERNEVRGFSRVSTQRLAELDTEDLSVNAGLLAAEVQETDAVFNLQFLQIQQQMQQENREFTLLSNIMKTKHDTARNAIENVR